MKKSLMILFFLAVLTCLPFIMYPSILVSRGNDLEEFFWPTIFFVKSQLLINHSIPLWNNLFFSGMPLITDPQSPIFYIPNFIFLFLNLDTAFLVSVFLHIFWATLGIYLLSKKGFKFSENTSLVLAAFYVFSPKLSAYVEAGHLGLIYSYGWLPWVFLFTVLLFSKPTIKKSIFLAISLAAIFFTHVLIFSISVICVFFVYLFLILTKRVDFRKKIIYFLVAFGFMFGLISIAFLPQLEWSHETTRLLLITNPDVYPKWSGLRDFFISSVSPIFLGYRFLWNLDTEKCIALGLGTLILAFFGFLQIRRKLKILIGFSILIVIPISLNNVSPIYQSLLSQNWYLLLRVSTRFWFIVIFLVLFLAGFAFEMYCHTKYKVLVIFLALITCGELLITSWIKMMKPIDSNYDLVSNRIYLFLKEDKDNFRVLCTTKCLSQKKLAIYNIQSVDGYGTLQQKNYYDYSQQLYQAFWRNKYTLAIPPYEIYNYEKFRPYPPSLTTFRVKYVISPYEIDRKNLSFVNKIDGYLIYKNELFTNPNYLIYSPNKIRFDTSDNQINIPEVYNSGWSAYMDGGKIPVNETVVGTIQVKSNGKGRYIDLIYRPESFIIGLLIMFSTILFIIISSFFSKL